MGGGTRSEERLRDVEHAVFRVLADADTLGEAGPQILEGICTALDWDFGAMWLVDTTGDRLRLAELWRRPEPRLAAFEQVCRARTFDRGVGLPGRVWEAAASAWIRDVVTDTNFPRASAALEAGLHAAFGFPVVVKGETYGVLEFFSGEIHEPDANLLELFTTIGAQVGRLIEREQMANALTFQTALLESQTEAAIDGIVIVSPENRIVHWNSRFLEMWRVSDDLMRAGDPEAVHKKKAEQARDPARFISMIQLLSADPLSSRRDEIELADGRVIDRWAAPVRGPDGTHYGRVLFYRDISAAKRTEARLRENEWWYTFLGEVGSVLSRTLDYRAALHTLATMAVPTLGDWCAIHVVDDRGEIVPIAVAHADARKADTVRKLQEHYPPDPEAATGIAEVIRSGTAALYEDIPEDALAQAVSDPGYLAQLLSLGLRSVIVVPLMGREGIVGTLSLVAGDSRPRFTKEDLRRAEDLAGRAAFPIDNARLYQERALVAQTLQQSLLPPRLPTVPGVEVAARYHAVAETAEVGGDFYDLYRAGNRAWGLFLGDVSGKGIEAATVTSLARHTLRTATMATQRPSEILAMLNAALLEQTEPDRFCTAVFALIEPRFGGLNIKVSSGGHPCPYVVRSNGTLEAVTCDGTLLGVVPNPELSDVRIDLDFGDKLILYTDGILDIRPEHGLFGNRELEALFAACGKRGVKASADLIEQEVLDLQGGQARDDFALLLLGVRASIFRRVRTPRLWSRAAESD